ncbi:MAG: hypothetical protein HMLIMOIP_001849 [Candidatus Nitrosomirales archaeon]
MSANAAGGDIAVAKTSIATKINAMYVFALNTFFILFQGIPRAAAIKEGRNTNGFFVSK